MNYLPHIGMVQVEDAVFERARDLIGNWRREGYSDGILYFYRRPNGCPTDFGFDSGPQKWLREDFIPGR